MQAFNGWMIEAHPYGGGQPALGRQPIQILILFKMPSQIHLE